eukprot:Seg2628.9 transcript_id=Seg2628.9/GoldUCD/mRNA.D3Y31 product="hypothetical protein" protein_id=Seg2628.9/GoldUCD/D3Y31
MSVHNNVYMMGLLSDRYLFTFVHKPLRGGSSAWADIDNIKNSNLQPWKWIQQDRRKHVVSAKRKHVTNKRHVLGILRKHFGGRGDPTSPSSPSSDSSERRRRRALQEALGYFPHGSPTPASAQSVDRYFSVLDDLLADIPTTTIANNEHIEDSQPQNMVVSYAGGDGSIDSGKAMSLASQPPATPASLAPSSNHSDINPEYVPDERPHGRITLAEIQDIFERERNRTPYQLRDGGPLTPRIGGVAAEPASPQTPPTPYIPHQLRHAHIAVRPSVHNINDAFSPDSNSSDSTIAVPEEQERHRNRNNNGARRIRARPIAGHNFYNAAFISNLPGLDAAAITKVKRMRVNLRKNWLMRYYREHNRAVPAALHSPAGSINDDNDLNVDLGAEQQQHVHAASPEVMQLPVPRAPLAQQPLGDDHDDELNELFRNRGVINRRNNLRRTLENYCTSDKSIADLKIFNRDYLQSIGEMCNDTL